MLKVKQYQTPQNNQKRAEFAETLLALLDSLNFDLVAIDEFQVAQKTTRHYNWLPHGAPAIVPVAGYWRSFNRIAAVGKLGLLKLVSGVCEP